MNFKFPLEIRGKEITSLKPIFNFPLITPGEKIIVLSTQRKRESEGFPPCYLSCSSKKNRLIEVFPCETNRRPVQ